jgi:hypothetical protein
LRRHGLRAMVYWGGDAVLGVLCVGMGPPISITLHPVYLQYPRTGDCGIHGSNEQLQRCCGELNTGLEYSYSKSQQDALFLKFILVKNSTCFEQTYCPSPGVLIPYSQHLVFVILSMLTVHPDVASRQSA